MYVLVFNEQLLNTVFERPERLVGHRSAAVRHAFVLAIVGATDAAAATRDIGRLRELYGALSRLYAVWESDELGVDLLDIGEYVSLTIHEVEAQGDKALDRTFLNDYRQGILSGI